MFRRPSSDFIDRVVNGQRDSQLTYPQIGLTRQSRCPPGVFENRWRATIGMGEQSFRRAKEALCGLRMLNLDWMEVVSAPASIHEGALVGTLIRMAGLYSLNVAKIIYVDDCVSSHTFEFAYGTLPEYPVSGEERFRVEFDPESEEVTYEVFSFSRITSPLAKLGLPFVRRAQRRFCRDSSETMRAVCQV